MYLEYYSIKRFFFFFVIWGKFCHFFDFGAFCFVWWWFERLVAENGFEPLTFGL